jgi:dTDP-4-amino-4,6-dideoxygalactose transaminase
MDAEKLAIHGGSKAKPTPYSRPNRYGDLEKKYLMEAVDEGALMMTRGSMVRRFEEAAAAKFGAKHAIMTTSGTTAIQTALLAAGVEEGDEVITTAVADAGTFMSILALHAVPVFADIDGDTFSATPEAVANRITPRTRAVLVVHMAGIVADMDAFGELGRRHGVAIVEDCSQSHGAKWGDAFVGTLGRIGAFSMNESKHMSCGDGGFMLTDDDETARVARLYIDKTYARGEVRRGEEVLLFAANNSRPNCLSAAVALAQLERLDENLARRDAIVSQYYRGLEGLPHLHLPRIHSKAACAWWPLPVLYTGDRPGRDDILAALQAEGLSISSALSPAKGNLHTQVIKRRRFYPYSDHLPHFLENVTYDENACPQADRIIAQVMRLPVDHRYTDEDIKQTVAGIRKVWKHFFGA